ncbi:hypothetical protein V1264_024229 [Littorina saxatilis]|uniref:SRCR domain-containing protein n=1 Tax=Littorina saxatilis TaxID=31220 RepID=A0AAN9AL38_9CAEN
MMTLTVCGLFGLFILLGYTSTPAKGLNEGDVRLRDGIGSSDGHVEIYSSSKEWVSICSGKWDENDARVVCRQLGKDT